MTSKNRPAVETRRRIEELFYDLNMEPPRVGEIDPSLPAFMLLEPVEPTTEQPVRITWDSLPVVGSSLQTQPAPDRLQSEHAQMETGQQFAITPKKLLEEVSSDPARQWGEDELMLVQQVSDQLSQALENAQLFNETQQARDALQVSVRYQKSIAEAMASLNERGFTALTEVLQILGEASQTQRVCYFETQQDQQGPFWRLVSEWHAADYDTLMVNPEMRHFSPEWITNWLDSLEKEGNKPHTIGASGDAGVDLLKSLDGCSILQIPLVFERELPGWLGFVQVDRERTWTPDEIAALQTAASAVTNTILRDKLFTQLQFNLSETEAQYQASAQLNSASDASEILTILRQFTILGHMNVSFISISLFDSSWSRTRRPQWLTQAAQWTPSHITSPFGERFDLRNWKNLPQLFTQDHPTIIFDIGNEMRLDPGLKQVFVGTLGAKSMLAVPLNVSGRWIGLIIAFYSQVTGFSEREIRRLVSLSQQAAIAVESLRLLDETRKRNEELIAMNHVASAVNQTLELNQVLEEILVRVLEVTGYDCGLISYTDRETDQLVLAVQHSLPDAMVDRLKEKGLAGTPCDLVFKTGKTIYIPNLDNLPDEVLSLDADLPANWQGAGVDQTFNGPRKFGFAAYLGTPIVAKGRSLGTVCVFSTSQVSVPPRRIALIEAVGQQVGVAVDNSYLFQSTQSALAETEVLYKASSELSAFQSYADIVSVLRQHTILGNAEKLVSIMLFDHAWQINDIARQGEQTLSTDEFEAPEWVAPIYQWSSLPPESQLDRYELQQFPAYALLSHSQTGFVADLEQDPRVEATSRRFFQERLQACSLLVTPLFIGNMWIGFVFGAFGSPTSFEETQLRRLSALASQAAISIQNLRLLDESRRRAGHLQTAAEIARDTSGTLAIEELFNRTVNLIKERFGFYHASIFLVDEPTGLAVVRESTGTAGEAMKKARHSLPVGGQSIVGQATGSGKAVLLNDVNEQQARKTHRPNPLLPNTQAELGIPLKIGDRVIGALDVQSDVANSFTEDDIAVLQTLADQIAIAVDNAQSYALAQKAVEEIREVDRLKTQFLANMSHELRTPLNSIIGFSRIILKGIDGPINSQQIQDLTAIYNSGQHLLGLINDVLDVSRIEAGKMDLAFEETNLVEIIRGVMSTTVGLVKDKPIELKQVLDPELPVITADSTKIRQVLINFLSNAAKFTERGSITLQAMRREGRDGQLQVIVRVIDTGPGIAKNDQAKLFQPFSQVDGSLTRKTGGSGLGLSICRRLIEMHHGEIGLESEVGRGSTFFFIIPVKQPEPAAQLQPVVDKNKPDIYEPSTSAVSALVQAAGDLPTHAKTTQGQNISHEGAREHPSAGSQKLVLAIDSDHQVIDLYRRYLASSTCSVISLTRLDQAVEAARGLQPCVITLDLSMKDTDQGSENGGQAAENPGEALQPLDGLAVLEKLKKDPTTCQIPVIICSMLSLQDKALELGAAEYLLKPILEEDLVNAVQRVQAKGKG